MQQDLRPLISIITLNYNQTDVTCEFLESLKCLDYRNYEVLVLDMASAVDPTEQLMAGNYENLQLIVSKENLGFAGGNNLGMRHAKGDFVFIVNNDTEVTPDLLTNLLAAMERDPAVGVVCPKIRYFEKKDTFQYAGYQSMNMYMAKALMVGTFEEDKGQYNDPSYTYFAHGAAMLLRKEVIEKTGGFRELFFLYYEELDWSSRIRRAGYELLYEPTGLIYHKESMSVGKNSTIKTYYQARNRILYMRRNASSLQMLAFTFFLLFMVVPKALLEFLFQGAFDHIKVFLKALTWHLSVPSSEVHREDYIYDEAPASVST